MEKVFLILSFLPRYWTSYFLKKFPNFFFRKERIVRAIYSEKNINQKNNTLKANFVQFRYNPKTGKNELSSNRFELETIENCRLLGRLNEDPQYDRNYYGLACIGVSSIKEFQEYTLKFTPVLDSEPKNYSHCDIYDDSIPLIQVGQALPPTVSYQKEQFKKRWHPYRDNGDLSFVKKQIQP